MKNKIKIKEFIFLKLNYFLSYFILFLYLDEILYIYNNQSGDFFHSFKKYQSI